MACGVFINDTVQTNREAVMIVPIVDDRLILIREYAVGTDSCNQFKRLPLPIRVKDVSTKPLTAS